MRLLVLFLFVCVANAASLGGIFGSISAGISGTSARGANTNRTPNLTRVAAEVVAAPIEAAKSIFTPAIEILAPHVSAVAVPPVAAPAAITDSTAGALVASDGVSSVSKSSSTDSESEITSYQSEVRADGYSYSFETSNGISVQSTGTLKKVDDVDVIVMEGSYEYKADDGTPVHVTYVADEKGYQPQSDILPTPPPVPEDIARAVAYIFSQIKSTTDKTEEAH